MSRLSFSLLPISLNQLHNTLICLAKFNETVSIEAEQDAVSLQDQGEKDTMITFFFLFF